MMEWFNKEERERILKACLDGGYRVIKRPRIDRCPFCECLTLKVNEDSAICFYCMLVLRKSGN